MLRQTSYYLCVLFVALVVYISSVSCGDATADAIATNRYNPDAPPHAAVGVVHTEKLTHSQNQQQQQHQHYQPGIQSDSRQHAIIGSSSNVPHTPTYHAPAITTGSGHIEKRNSYNLLSEAMSQAVSNEFSSLGSGSADGACHADDLECNVQDRLGMEAIRTLHRQLDDDDNGNIDLSESDDFLREELKYDSGYEKRQKAFHFNDDMHISVKELWEAWLRSEVHNWTMEQTTDWLAQSVQLPQYVELFKLHKVTGAALPRLAVNNMHYVGNVLGIKDPIHKQKIALKAMDVVLFGPPRETGTRWKDYILVTLLLSAIIGCWYAYQQNKNAKRHLRRMAQDMEGLQRAEQSLQEMQKELERARMEQENVETEKMDLERRLKEAPMLTSSSSDLEVQQLKKEIEILRNELSRAEIELVDNCYTPPPQLQSWLQYTYELESKNHLKKRMSAEKQLQSAREACEKLRKKRSSLVGAFVSTHGKSIDDVDRSIVEARNSLGEVTNELQERLHRWKQIESCLGFNITNNNGLAYLESVLYGRNGGIATSISSKGSRGRMTSSTDDLDDESVQGMFDNYSRSSVILTNNSSNSNVNVAYRDDSSSSEEGGVANIDSTQTVQFYLGNAPTPPALLSSMPPERPLRAAHIASAVQEASVAAAPIGVTATVVGNHISGSHGSCSHMSGINSTAVTLSKLHHSNTAQCQNYGLNDSASVAEGRHSPSVSSDGSIPVPPRSKKQNLTPDVVTSVSGVAALAPLPPPRKAYQSSMPRSKSTELVLMDTHAYFARQQQQPQHQKQQQQQLLTGIGCATPPATSGCTRSKMVKQHSTASQQSTSSTSSSVQSAPPIGGVNADNGGHNGQLPCAERITPSGHIELHRFYARNRDKEPLQQPHYAGGECFGPVQQLPTSFSLQSLCSKPQCDGTRSVVDAPRPNTTTTSTSSHRDTKLEDREKLHNLHHAADTVSLTDTISLDGGSKKRRRRLRFPFGSSKKSTSTSAPHSSEHISDETTNYAGGKAKTS